MIRNMVCLFLVVGIGNVPGHAQTMPASTFLAKAEALEKNAAMALLSSDLGLLKREAGNSFIALEAEASAARKAGLTPAYCKPPKASLNSMEILDYLKAVPAAHRPMPIKQALLGLMKKKFPCSGSKWSAL